MREEETVLKGIGMDDSTRFGDAMRLNPVSSDGAVTVFDGMLNRHWTIGAKVHGGAMLALCANAARTVLGAGGPPACGGERSDSGNVLDGDMQPIAVSGSFLWAPDPGPLRVVTTLRKRGRRLSLIDVELHQQQRIAVRAALTLAAPEHDVAPLLSMNPVAPLMTPEPPPGLEPIGPGHPMADIVHLAHGCDIRPSLTTMAPRADGGPPVIEYWAPTVQLTAYLRAIPADGWLRVMCTTMQIGQDWFDEDHVVVDCEGRIVVQSRQLALVPPAP